MFALVSPEKVHLPAGSVVKLPATWQEYQNLSEGRGDSSIPRMKYRQGEVLLMSPVPVHGKDANLITDANFLCANLNKASLQDANLSRANLMQTQLQCADLTGATLTGAYIKDWGITTTTKLNRVKCDYELSILVNSQENLDIEFTTRLENNWQDTSSTENSLLLNSDLAPSRKLACERRQQATGNRQK